MFNTWRTAAAKLKRSGSGSGSQSLSEHASGTSEPRKPDQIASDEQADTLGDFQSFPRRSSISKDKGRRSVDGRKPHGTASSSGLKVQMFLIASVFKQACHKNSSSCFNSCRAQKLLQAVKGDLRPPTSAPKVCWMLVQGALDCPATLPTQRSMVSKATPAAFTKELKAAGCPFSPCSLHWQMSQCMEHPVANLCSKPAWKYQQLQLALKSVKVHQQSLHVQALGQHPAASSFV